MAVIQKGHPDFYGYIDFINYCFGMNGTSHAFNTLLPKLYADGKTSGEHTYFALEGDKIVGTVLAYPLTFHIGGHTLSARGIGSVATHPRYRGEGFMKAMMKRALDDMVKDGVAFSVLGGRRRRYAFFGFEKCDAMSYFNVTPKTVSYLSPSTAGYSMKRICREDTVLLDLLHTKMHSRPYYTERARCELYDILVSWYSTPYAFFEGEELVGWAIHYASKRQFSEFEGLKPSAVPAMLALSVQAFGELSIAVPKYELDKASLIDPYTENITDVSNECFLVLDWQSVLTALFDLKAKTQSLCDGTLTVEIAGYAKTERLKITVKGGVPTVEACEDTPDLSLSLCDAEVFFFRNLAPDRAKVDPRAASWLPLPLFIHEPDNV